MPVLFGTSLAVEPRECSIVEGIRSAAYGLPKPCINKIDSVLLERNVVTSTERDNMRKVLGLGVAAVVVAAAFAAPAQAAPVTAPVVVASTVEVEAPLEVVAFDSPAVTTVAAPVAIVAEVEPVENISTEPGVAVEENESVATEPVEEVVEVTEPPAEVTPPVVEVVDPVDPVTEPTTPTDPVDPVEPATPAVEEPVEIAPDPYSPEILEGERFKGEGEDYVGSFYSLEDSWTAQGNRVVKSETIFKSADGNPLSNNYIYIWHVYAPVA